MYPDSLIPHKVFRAIIAETDLLLTAWRPLWLHSTGPARDHARDMLDKLLDLRCQAMRLRDLMPTAPKNPQISLAESANQSEGTAS